MEGEEEQAVAVVVDGEEEGEDGEEEGVDGEEEAADGKEEGEDGEEEEEDGGAGHGEEEQQEEGGQEVPVLLEKERQEVFKEVRLCASPSQYPVNLKK